MKGFVHIVEIVIITFVVFVLITQVSSVPPISSDWGKTKLEIQARDILLSLYHKNISWLNKTEVDTELKNIFQNTSTRYALRIDNALKDNITVGCFCDDNEYKNLKSMLYPFVLNDQRITFLVKKLDMNSSYIPSSLDVLVLNNNVNNISYDAMKNFVSMGKGIVEIADLSENDINSSLVQKNIFGLWWNNNLVPGSENITFSIGSESEFYNIYKYFHAIPNLSGWLPPEGYEFKNFLANEKIDSFKTDNIILLQKSTRVPAAIVNNKIFDDKGRAVWISAGNDASEEKKMLIRALILWSTGETYNIIENDMSNPVSFSVFKFLKKSDYTIGMNQVIKITLFLDHIFS